MVGHRSTGLPECGPTESSAPEPCFFYFYLFKVGERSLVYTGDYNMTPDRHLGAARIDKCRPDLLITESTYATTIRCVVLLFHSLGVCVILMRSLTKELGIRFENLENSNLFTSPC